MRWFYGTVEAYLRWRGRLRGVCSFPDPFKHFGPGGVDEAERQCAEIGRDLLGYFRPPADVRASRVERVPLPPIAKGAVEAEEIRFDSPLPSGDSRNDRVQVRLWTPRGLPTDRVVVFHHPVFQDSWAPWQWFLDGLVRRVPVAMLAAPWHFDRTPAGWFPGEGIVNANPVRVLEAIRQWFADQRALHRLLAEELDHRPVCVVGYSLGAFQALLAAADGELTLPIVAVAPTSRYAWGLTRGVLARPVVVAMRRAGIDEPRLFRMVEALQLERYADRVTQPVLLFTGRDERADPPPSIERLLAVLPTTRNLVLPAGHASLALLRKRIWREVFRFFDELKLFVRA